MGVSFGNPVAVAREIQGQFRQGTDKIVSVGNFGKVAKVLWPFKTAAHLAAIASRCRRGWGIVCRRDWLFSFENFLHRRKDNADRRFKLSG